MAKYKEWLTDEGLLKLAAWARDGLTDEQIAKNIGIRRSTLSAWKTKFSDISDTLKKGKDVVDIQVENAMHKRAVGFKETVKKVKFLRNGTQVEYEEEIYYPPDPTSGIFWLKNRKSASWRDKQIEADIEDPNERIRNWIDATKGDKEEGLFNEYDDEAE